MALDNIFIGYVDRTYEQIKSNVLLKFGNNVPEITDHTDSNPWVKGINVFAGIAEMLNYYIDVNARESYLSTAKLFRSAVKLGKFFDYRSRGGIAATVDLTFTVDNPTPSIIPIPEGTQVSTKEGLVFLTNSNVQINIGETEVVVSATQHEEVLNVALGTSDGSKNQIYILEEKVEYKSAVIKVDTDIYSEIDTFANAIDTSQVFISELNEDSQIIVEFGDGINGVIPPAPLNITADYFVTEGLSGNVAPQTITVIDSTITVPSGFILTVNNIEGASGGADKDTLSTLKKKIPLANRTKYRAVTEQDFVDVTELAPGVESAGVDYDCGKFVDIFIVPEGGGIASNALITSVENWLRVRKIITTNVNAQSAGQIVLQFNINVNVIPNQNNALVEQSIRDRFDDFFDSENQSIQGTVYLSDIYQLVEGTTGVLNSDIFVMKAVPYARPTNNTLNLDWTRELSDDNALTNKFEIRFTLANKFELLKNNVFIDSFFVGNLVSLDEIEFTINVNNVAGNRYVFYTYKSFGNLVLSEPSIPAVNQSLLSLNVTGGV